MLLYVSLTDLTIYEKTVAELMTWDVVHVEPTTTLSQCAHLMSQHRISSILICEGAKPLGILTERDIVRLYSQNIPLVQPVSIQLPMNLIIVGIDTDYREACHKMIINNIRHLIVVDEVGHLAGIVTETDLRRNVGVEDFIGLRKVTSIMNRNVLLIKPDISVTEAALLMYKHQVSCAVVIDGVKPISIITERDIVHLCQNTKEIQLVRDLESRALITIAPEQLVINAAQLMQSEEVRHLIVINSQGEVVATVNEHDIVQNTEEQYVELLKKIIHEQIIELHLKQSKIDQMALQTALIESEARLLELENHTEYEKMLLRALLDSVPDLIYLKNTDSVYLACNSAFEKFFGTKEQNIIGKTDFDFIDPQTAGFFCRNDQEAILSGTSKTNEEWVVYPDGHRVCLETQKTPYKNQQGLLVGTVGISRPITHRKNAEDALLLSEEKLHALFNILPMGISRNTVSGRFIDANPSLLNMLGYPLQELTNLSFWDITPEGHEDKDLQQLLCIENSGRFNIHHKELLHRDGYKIPVSINGIRVINSDREQYIWSIFEKADRPNKTEA